MIENYRSDLVWRVMRRSPYLQQGLERAGFSGGWLTPLEDPQQQPQHALQQQTVQR
jgi:hypothetical protein